MHRCCKILEKNWRPMRLNQKDQAIIHKTILNFLPNSNVKIFLFGSRTDLNKKGGDIDLLLICNPADYEMILDQKNILKSEIEYALDEQRVDLTIATEDKINTDVFLRSIQKDLVEF